MKITILTLTSFLLFTNQILSQNIDIPDSNFLSALIEAGVDISGDGQIDSVEARATTSLSLVNKDIADLTGIEAFVNLDSLDCGFNQLSVINISHNKMLRYLNFWDNELDSINVTNNTLLEEFWGSFNNLTSLDVSKNLQLKILYVGSNEMSAISTINNIELIKLGFEKNQIKEFDISNNIALEYLNCGNNGISNFSIEDHSELINLYCDNNSLSELNVSNNQNLSYLRCNSNELTSIDLSNNPNLEFLDCTKNQLSSLDISINTVLETLICGNNQLYNIDLSNNPILKTLSCSNNLLITLDLSRNLKIDYLICSNNNLSELNVTKNTLLEILWCGSNAITRLDISRNELLGNYLHTRPYLDISNLPQLSEVCVWELPFPPMDILMDTTGSPNVKFTMDCTPILVAPDSLYQPDTFTISCSLNSTVYLVPENTGNAISEIYNSKIDSFYIIADDISNFALPGLTNGTYWLYAISDTKKVSEPEAFTIFGVGIENDVCERIRVYPIPTNGQLIVDTDIPDQYSILITSLNGQLLFQSKYKGKTQQIDVSELHNGIYFITIGSTKHVYTRKFIKL